MGEYEVVMIPTELAGEAEGLLTAPMAEALKKKLPVTAIAAVTDNTIVGALAGYLTDDSFEITSLYVHPDYRRRGAGRALINKLEELLEDSGISLVAEYTLTDEDGQTNEEFFRAMGFTEDSVAYPRFLCGRLKDFHVRVKNVGSLYDDIRSFAEMPEKVFKNPAAFGGGDLPVPEGAFSAKDIDNEASFFALMDERLIACVISEVVNDASIRINACGTDGPEMGEISLLLSYAEEELTGKYRPETGVMMLVTDPGAEKMIGRVLKDPRVSSYRFLKAYQKG